MHLFHSYKFVDGETMDLRCYLRYRCKCNKEKLEPTTLGTMMRMMRYKGELEVIEQIRRNI